MQPVFLHSFKSQAASLGVCSLGLSHPASLVACCHVHFLVQEMRSGQILSWRCLHSLTTSSCLQMGVNAMLVRSCLEAVGTLARALQGGLTSNGRLLRAVLLPVLERLTDPCASVAASAAAAISSLCFHGGYATLGQLVASNADYVVDGLCKQLRRLSDHPMSVPLFLVVMPACDRNAALSSSQMRGRQASCVGRKTPSLMAVPACGSLSALPCTDAWCHQQTLVGAHGAPAHAT